MYDRDVSTRNKYENIVKVEKEREPRSCGVGANRGSSEGSAVWRDIGKGVKESIRVEVRAGVRGVENTSQNRVSPDKVLKYGLNWKSVHKKYIVAL